VGSTTIFLVVLPILTALKGGVLDPTANKKYFYVLRPIMACMWIERYNESPPMEFEKLLTQISGDELLEKINDLLARKKSGIELGLESRITMSLRAASHAVS
jgi:predicted nucleotidyltransferase